MCCTMNIYSAEYRESRSGRCYGSCRGENDVRLPIVANNPTEALGFALDYEPKSRAEEWHIELVVFPRVGIVGQLIAHL